MAEAKPKPLTTRKERLQKRLLQTMERSVKGARIAILVVAVFTALSALFPYVAYQQEASLQQEVASRNPEGNVGVPDLAEAKIMMVAVVVISLFIAAIFFALYFLAKKRPVGATMTALIIHLGLLLLAILTNPAYLLGFPLIKEVLIVGTLVYGVKAARRYKRTMEQQALEAESIVEDEGITTE